MKSRLFLTTFLAACLLASTAWASLDVFLNNLNVQAQADLPGFKLKLATQFGIPVPQVDAIIAQVRYPADAFMTLQLGQMAHKQPEAVIQTYQYNKGKGWGVIAKRLGIKPGSAEFHALKRGDLHFSGQPRQSPEQDHDRTPGHGKGKGRNK